MALYEPFKYDSTKIPPLQGLILMTLHEGAAERPAWGCRHYLVAQSS